MIFWGTVLAFILGIMYYMLYPYDTKISTVYMPSSEAYVAGFVTQHQAAKDYAREAVIAINRLTETLPNHDENHSVLILSHSDSDQSPIDSFLPESVSSMQTKSFQPKVQEESGELADNMGFVSLLACFDRPERKLNDSNEYTPAKLTDCRAATTKYVMTYGPLPNEMDSLYMRGKTLLFEAALLKRTKGNPDCGFLYYDENTGRYFINNSHHLTRTVPNQFIKLLSNGGYFYGEDKGRILVGGNDDARELLFCMTPVNDPYPRLGLRVLLDGTINQLPSNNTIEHSPTLPNNGWINLAKENSQPLEIKGSMRNNWNTYCSATNETCHADGFSFSKNRSITIPAGWFDSKQSDIVLGVPSTVSFMALFKNDTYTVFETKSSNANDNSIKATYSSGRLTFTLSKNSKTYTISAVIQPEKMTQVDYILNPSEHKLYIDGELKDQGKFGSADSSEETISAITGTSFDLGGGSADYILYNFLIYNRSPEAGEALKQSIDLYGLPRIYKSNMLRYIKKTGIQKITEDDEGEKE